MKDIWKRIKESKMAKWPMEKWFLLVAGILGVAFILILPVGQSPDDIMHFRRAYGITEGVLIPSVINENGGVGSAVPVDTEEVLETFPEAGHYGEVVEELGSGVAEKTEQAYNNTALYNFVCYIPQSLAIMIGKIFGLSTAGLAYLARIFNFVLWAVLVYFAIKLIPKFKKIVLFIALLPITLQEATSLAPDALAIGLGIFLISYVVYLAYGRKEKLSRKELVLLYTMAGVMGFCKIVYLPLVLLYLIIPEERFGSKKKKWIHLAIIGTLVVVLNLAWLAVSSGFLVEFNPGVNSKEQLVWIMSHPFGYVVVIARTIVANMQLWISNMLGMHLGSFVFNLPSIVFLMSFAMFVVLFMQRDETLKIKKFDRIVFIVTFLIITMLIFTSLYIQWTAVSAPIIDGIQGRYFLPILLLVPLIFCRKDNKKIRATLISERAVLCYSVIVNIVALVLIFTQNR